MSSLEQLYSNRGNPERSVVLHAWKQVGEWGSHDPSGKSKRAERIAVHLSAGIWGGLETTGRGVAAWTVGNRVSSFIANQVIPCFTSAENAEKAKRDYMHTKNFTERSFDDCIHGTTQCFQSVGTNTLNFQCQYEKAESLRNTLDQHEVGGRIVEIIESIDPILIAQLIAALSSRNVNFSRVGGAGAEIFINVFKTATLHQTNHSSTTSSSSSSSSSSSNQTPPAPQNFEVNSRDSIIMQRLLLTQIRNIDDLKFIPPAIEEEDAFLGENICPITQCPIRFIVMVETQNNSAVFYEKKALEDWLSNKSNELPPNWPNNVEFRSSVIQEEPEIQRTINTKILRAINTFLRRDQSEAAWEALGAFRRANFYNP